MLLIGCKPVSKGMAELQQIRPDLKIISSSTKSQVICLSTNNNKYWAISFDGWGHIYQIEELK